MSGAKREALTTQDLAAWGKEALTIEARALERTSRDLGESFATAILSILDRQGKVVVTGLGKSGHVARKIASTMSSTGTSAFFLHPTEALHGDFGMLQPNDCLIAIAFGGETAEVVEVAKFARRIGVPVIGITGKVESSLAKLCDFVLDGGVEKEADLFGLAPTASSTVAMALGDAIAITLMRARGFSALDFANLHPGGSLGRRLSLVKDHMHGSEHLPKVDTKADFHQILEAVTAYNFGIVAVVTPDGDLLGAISDGDLRRALLKYDAKALSSTAADLMTGAPKTIEPTVLAIDALRIMNDKQITQLFVVDSQHSRKLLGIVRLHDLLSAKIV